MSLRLLSSMATREPLRELAADYRRSTHIAVEAEAAGGVDVARRVESGETVDVVVLASGAIDKLLGSGRLVGGRVDIARSEVAIAVRAGAVKPAIDSEEALKRTVAAVRSLSYSTGPSGVYLEGLFARWGMMEDLRGRIVVPPPGTAVGVLVAAGRAELGFQQLSELMTLPGIDVVGPLPAEIRTETVFSGAVAASGGDFDAARTLLDYLAAPSADAVKARYGLRGPRSDRVATTRE